MTKVKHLLALRNGWDTASCGGFFHGTDWLTPDATKVTCRACLVLLPAERASALRVLEEVAAATGPVAVVAVTVRVTRTETVVVKVTSGPGARARAERLALLTHREEGVTDVHVTSEVVDKRHSHQ